MALTASQIPCCLCGKMILPNAANQCPSCLAQEINLKQRLQQGPGGAEYTTIHQCRQCRRFQRSEKVYEHAEPESPELLALCLKHIPALSPSSTGGSGGGRIHLVDAGWIWTEPHSMRLKVHLTVRTEVQNVAVQQRVMVELHNKFKMCPDCNREYTNRTWHAVVQLRQKRADDAPKKGLAVLEMALARNRDIRRHVLRINTAKNGFDFYFLSLAHAQTFCAFLQRVAPMRVKTSKKLVSTDVKNNTANLKHTLTCDMVPLCRDDLVLIHKGVKGAKLAGRLALVTKVSSVIHLLDASPKRDDINEETSHMELSPETFYRNEKSYSVLQASHRLSRFVVLDVELCGDNGHHPDEESVLYNGPSSGIEKYALADVQVARESDFGVNDETISSVTHLGHLIQPGDVALGYDLVSTVGADWELEESFHNHFVQPDVVLVKKVSGNADKHEVVDDGKKRMSKKKERRQKKEGKRMRELEESAVRMGFFEDDEVDPATLESELSTDPELAQEVAALERDLAALDEGGTSDGEAEDT